MCRLTTCGKCRFFQPVGHYRGSCARLDSMVVGEWSACHLGQSAFGLLDRQDFAVFRFCS
jgi:hypothetical protein